MRKALVRIIVLMAVLFSFIGQAIAIGSSTSCESSQGTYVSHENQLSMQSQTNDIDTHDHGHNDDDCCDTECCADTCLCFGNACSFSMFIMASSCNIRPFFLNEACYLSVLKFPQFIAQSMFRPPIFTS